MVADWRPSISGVVGSSAVHLAGVLWLLAALFAVPIWEPGWRGQRGSLQMFEAPHPDPAFALTPVLFDHESVFQLSNRDCGGSNNGRVPVLLGSARFPEHRVMPRQPLVCVRIDPNGEVTAARVLLSSGKQDIDAAVEGYARNLIFEAARAGEPMKAVTVTIEVTGGRRPNAAPVVRLDAVQPGIPPL